MYFAIFIYMWNDWNALLQFPMLLITGIAIYLTISVPISNKIDNNKFIFCVGRLTFSMYLLHSQVRRIY